MKKILLILCAAVLALVSCNKDLTPNEAKRGEPVDVVFNLSATHPDGGGTKAVKDSWETGDVVFVFFSGQTAPAYLELKYDGSKWENNQKGLSFTAGETGTMTAVYLPFGSDAAVVADGTSYKFDKTYYSYYLISSMTYTVSDGEVSGTFSMQIPDGYVQFFLAENPNVIYSEDWLIELREPHLMPMGVASISASGDVATTSLAQGAPLPGYMYDKEVKGEGESKGFVFSGILSEDARNVETDYHFTLVEGGWNGFYVSKTIEDKKLYRGPQAGRALNLQKSGWDEMDYIPIDLGMDIGGKRVYWAYKNVGASKPEDYGDYFAWGATVPFYAEGHSQDNPCSDWISGKTGYNWASYPFMQSGKSSWEYITKYTFADDQTSGIWYDVTTFKGDNGDGVEHKDLASYDYADDAARANWGGSWRMPTDAEWTWLRENCTWTWNSELKAMVVSKDGRSIILPAAGLRSVTSLGSAGSYGYYWSSSLLEFRSNFARVVYFDSEGENRSSYYRYFGFSVRPVCD